jgi:hypothetical protein
MRLLMRVPVAWLLETSAGQRDGNLRLGSRFALRETPLLGNLCQYFVFPQLFILFS